MRIQTRESLSSGRGTCCPTVPLSGGYRLAEKGDGGDEIGNVIGNPPLSRRLPRTRACLLARRCSPTPNRDAQGWWQQGTRFHDCCRAACYQGLALLVLRALLPIVGRRPLFPPHAQTQRQKGMKHSKPHTTPPIFCTTREHHASPTLFGYCYPSDATHIMLPSRSYCKSQLLPKPRRR